MPTFQAEGPCSRPIPWLRPMASAAGASTSGSWWPSSCSSRSSRSGCRAGAPVVRPDTALAFEPDGEYRLRLSFRRKCVANDEEMKAELEKLRAENAALKSRGSKGVSMKVSEKGAVSVYGLGRF